MPEQANAEIAVATADALQTLIPQSAQYPIPLSVFWLRISVVHEQNLAPSVEKLADNLLKDATYSHDVDFLIFKMLIGCLQQQIKEIDVHTEFSNWQQRYLEDLVSGRSRVPNAGYPPSQFMLSQEYSRRLLELRRRLEKSAFNERGFLNRREAAYRSVIEYVANSKVIVNKSPPQEEFLGKLISGGVTGIGMYAGLSVAPAAANPYVLLSCVAGGIIIVSTAAGIGRALQDALYERIYNALKGKNGNNAGSA